MTRVRTLEELQKDIRTLRRVPSEFIDSKLNELADELAEHDKQIREEAYAKGASDMEKAKQIIIDTLLKQLNEIKSLLPMCDQYDNYDCSSSKDECFECMYQALDKIEEQLKGAENE